MFARSALLAFALSALPALAVKDLELKVVGPETVTDVDNFTVKTLLINNGDETITLLNDPNSILTPQWKTNVFGITKGNSAAKFGGVRVKWSPALAIANKEFTVIAPGQTIEIDQDLSRVYNLTASGAGSYTIDAKSDFKFLTASGGVDTITASVSNGSTVRFAGKLASSNPLAARASLSKRQSYVGCTSTRQSQIATAVTSANSYLSAANSYLSTLSSGTARYTTWFGSYTASRASTVKSHFSLMTGDPSASTYDCTCTDSAYAYVYPDDTGYIYLCNAFWSAPNTGTDSRAGTIIHEQSHFTVNGGTDDYAYGQSAAKSLAISSPATAVMNADSHEYFAENTPAQS